MTPQAYDVKVQLSDKDVVSNSIVAHYVLRGNSATIQTLSLDKDGYSSGEIANINLLWSPSADSFPGSRAGSGSTLSPVTMTVSIVNSKGFSCISPISQIIEATSIDLTPKIKRECKNPKVTAELKDDKGNILAQKVLSFETKTDLAETDDSSNKTLILIFGILIVVGLALYFINLKKKQNETIIQ